MAKKKIGMCQLTGIVGQFCKSHLLPKALTRPAIRGMPFIEFGEGSGRPIRRWSSWTDQELVTKEGEKILADLDDWAIKALRKHELVWSGWKGETLRAKDWIQMPSLNSGVRSIDGIDGKRLRRFFHSLLWRAAATKRPEFGAVDLPPMDLELIRQNLLTGAASPQSFYPVELVQLSTQGPIHNHVPLRNTKGIPDFGNGGRDISIFRFYFDGLIAHIHRRPFDEHFIKGLGSMLVGAEATLTAATVSYETSFQKEILTALQDIAERDFPDVMCKI